jgi:hypothetical protein
LKESIGKKPPEEERKQERKLNKFCKLKLGAAVKTAVFVLK